MPTKIIEDDYARKVMPELIGKTLIVKYWDDHDEDYVGGRLCRKPRVKWLRVLCQFRILEN